MEKSTRQTQKRKSVEMKTQLVQGQEQNETAKNRKTAKASKKGGKTVKKKAEAQFNEDDEVFTMTLEGEQELFPEVDEAVPVVTAKVNKNANATVGRRGNQPVLQDKLEEEGIEELDYYESELEDSQEQLSEAEREDDQISDDEIQLNIGVNQAKGQLIQKAKDVDDRVRQEIIGETVAHTMRQLMEEGRLKSDEEMRQPIHKFRQRDEQSRSRGKSKDELLYGKGNKSHQGDNAGKTNLSVSDLTIYERAVRDETNKRISSSSSDESPDTSDEALI